MKRNQGYSVLFSVLLLLSLSAMVYGIISVFSIIPAIVFSVFLAYNCLPDRIIENLKKKRWYGIIYKTVADLSVFGGILCGVTLVIMLFYAFGATNENPDTVIVLGCQVKGQQPSLMLRDRLETAYDYLAENENATVIVSGGQGADEEVSEAEVMEKYLISKGISKDRIIKEDRSVNTDSNIKNSAQIIKNRNLSTDVLIVTDWYHQLRANKMAQKLALNPSARSTFTKIWLVEPMFYREVCAVVKFLIVGA